MAEAILGSTLMKYLPMLKVGAVGLLVIIILAFGFYYVLVVMKRKSWKVTIHEQKADGRIHIIGNDLIQEKKMKGGTVTIYWLRGAKTEVVPPPHEVVYRVKGKEFVEYMRIERDFIPMTRHTGLPTLEDKKIVVKNLNDKAVRIKLTKVYDKMLSNIRGIKTTYFDSAAIADRYIYTPIDRVMTTKVSLKTVPYDLNIMAQNKISNAEEFFSPKYEFWKKYGAAITLGLTIIFLIIVVFLTYDYMAEVVNTLMGHVQSNTEAVTNLMDSMGRSGAKPPN